MASKQRIPFPLAPSLSLSMEVEARLVLLSLFLAWYSGGAVQYQTFVPGTLPGPVELRSETEWVGSEASESDSEARLSLRLQHIDAFSPSTTSDVLFTRRLQRDSLRVRTLSGIASNRSRKAFSSSVVSGLTQGSGEYFTTVGIGSPPRSTYLVLDTGSDIIWIQCLPCKQCYNQTGRVFDPTRSKTFRPVSCSSAYCHALDAPGCNARRQNCVYQVAYGDGSVTIGELASETLSFRETEVDGVVLGCGHYNEGLFVGAAGLLGLGRGKLSFPTLAGDRFDRKFSYCLVDRSSPDKPSSVVFGSVPRVGLYTPLVMNPKLETFYYVTLKGISVGGSPVRDITQSLFAINSAGNGGVIIDSGTSVTRLNRPAYVALREAFKSATRRLRSAERFSLFDTCYDLSGRSTLRVPTVVLHFSGADVALPASNYLIPVDLKGTFCFAFAPTSGGLSIIGNIQQQGFRVSFDLKESRVGFTPRGCA